MNDYLDGLLEGPSGLTNVVSQLGPILGLDIIMLVSKWLRLRLYMGESVYLLLGGLKLVRLFC